MAEPPAPPRDAAPGFEEKPDTPTPTPSMMRFEIHQVLAEAGRPKLAQWFVDEMEADPATREITGLRLDLREGLESLRKETREGMKSLRDDTRAAGNKNLIVTLLTLSILGAIAGVKVISEWGDASIEASPIEAPLPTATAPEPDVDTDPEPDTDPQDDGRSDVVEPLRTERTL